MPEESDHTANTATPSDSPDVAVHVNQAELQSKVRTLSRRNDCWYCTEDLSGIVPSESNLRRCPRCGGNVPVLGSVQALSDPQSWMYELQDDNKNWADPITEEELRKALVLKYFVKPEEVTADQIRANLTLLMNSRESFRYVASANPPRVASECRAYGDPKDWEDLRHLFLEQKSSRLTVLWGLQLEPRVHEEWEFVDRRNQDEDKKFIRLARRAETLLGIHTQDDGPPIEWLTLLRKDAPQEIDGLSTQTMYGDRKNGGISRCLYNLFTQSAALCFEYATRAMKAKAENGSAIPRTVAEVHQYQLKIDKEMRAIVEAAKKVWRPEQKRFTNAAVWRAFRGEFQNLTTKYGDRLVLIHHTIGWRRCDSGDTNVPEDFLELSGRCGRALNSPPDIAPSRLWLACVFDYVMTHDWNGRLARGEIAVAGEDSVTGTLRKPIENCIEVCTAAARLSDEFENRNVEPLALSSAPRENTVLPDQHSFAVAIENELKQLADSSTPPVDEAEQSPPPPPNRRGRPAKIAKELKQQALDCNGTNRKKAEILYQTKMPSTRQVKNVRPILNHYKASLSPPTE